VVKKSREYCLGKVIHRRARRDRRGKWQRKSKDKKLAGSVDVFDFVF
jgi:hypothetical protein